MKTIVRIMIMLMVSMFAMTASAKKYPEIKFEKTTIDVGVFSQDKPVQTVTFKFTNVGKEKLVINYVHTSCGCTLAEYPKDYISPGASGEIKVTYDGTGKLPGKFKKTIQVFSNCKEDMARIFISGEMSAVQASDLENGKKK